MGKFVVLVLACALVLAGCGSNEQSEADVKKQLQKENADRAVSSGDSSGGQFNRQADRN